MTKDVIPGSRAKTYTENLSLVKELNKKTGLNYEIPKLKEAITGIFTKYVDDETCLYDAGTSFYGLSATYTYCQENSKALMSCFKCNRSFVGCYSPRRGLKVELDFTDSRNDLIGVGVLRKLNCSNPPVPKTSSWTLAGAIDFLFNLKKMRILRIW